MLSRYCIPWSWFNATKHVLHNPRMFLRLLFRRCLSTTVQHDSSNILPVLRDKPFMQPPSQTTLTMQIMAAASSGRLPACFQIAAKMKAAGITPDISTYNALMSAVAQDSNALFSWAILDDMLLVGVRPSTTTFAHLMDVIMTCCHFRVFPLTATS